MYPCDFVCKLTCEPLTWLDFTISSNIARNYVFIQISSCKL